MWMQSLGEHLVLQRYTRSRVLCCCPQRRLAQSPEVTDGLAIFPPTSVGFGSKPEMKVRQLLPSFAINNVTLALHAVIMRDGSGPCGLSGLPLDAGFIPSHSAGPSPRQYHPSLRSATLPQSG